MTDRLVSWIRTVVPAAWAAVLAWLVKLGLPAEVVGLFGGLADTLIVPVVLGLVLAVIRWLESRLPAWLSRILMGSARTPAYSAPAGSKSG